MTIAEALAQHKIWLNDPKTGRRAYLAGAYLAGANLADANLRRANLVGATITLTDANIIAIELALGGLYG